MTNTEDMTLDDEIVAKCVLYSFQSVAVVQYSGSIWLVVEIYIVVSGSVSFTILDLAEGRVSVFLPVVFVIAKLMCVLSNEASHYLLWSFTCWLLYLRGQCIFWSLDFLLMNMN